MIYRQGLAVASGVTEGTIDFRFPRDHYIQSFQLTDLLGYALYVRAEWYNDDSDDIPEILFAGWLQNSLTYNDTPSITLNKFVDYEKGFLRFNILNRSGNAVIPIVTVYYADRPTHQVNYYDEEKFRGLWAYDDQIERHTSAGVITVDFIPLIGTWFEIDSLRITAGFTGAEDLTISHLDGANAVVKLLGVASTTAGVLELPILVTSEEDNVASTPSSVGKLRDTLRIKYPDKLRIDVSSVPATDDINIRMRAWLKSAIPTVTLGANCQTQAGYTAEYSVVR